MRAQCYNEYYFSTFLTDIYLYKKSNTSTRRRQWYPTLVLLLGKSHGRRSLVGCSPWGRWESDMTEWLHFHFSLSCTGEGNGNPLQCSCLENPRDGGAWWAAVYGVTQSRTRLKWLSSSSSNTSTHAFMLIWSKINYCFIFTDIFWDDNDVYISLLLASLTGNIFCFFVLALAHSIWHAGSIGIY